jgi:hypothetical protein
MKLGFTCLKISGGFMRNSLIVFATLIVCSVAWGQAQSNASGSTASSMPGMDTSAPHHDMSSMKDTPKTPDKEDSEAGPHVMHAMEGHMDMGPHMRMTELRQSHPGDADRAQKVVEAARKADEKYEDYHVALAEGFKIFLPNVPQKMYHFTNYGYAMEAAFYFNPEHPTSLLYEKRGDDYKLIGVMYTAPKRLTEDQLDERIPLSVAQWHEHVNFCAPPAAARRKEMLQPHPQFGLHGSIATQEACDAAGGTFHPVVFNWMVHVYPFEKDQARIWSVERQHND